MGIEYFNSILNGIFFTPFSLAKPISFLTRTAFACIGFSHAKNNRGKRRSLEKIAKNVINGFFPLFPNNKPACDWVGCSSKIFYRKKNLIFMPFYFPDLIQNA